MPRTVASYKRILIAAATGFYIAGCTPFYYNFASTNKPLPFRCSNGPIPERTYRGRATLNIDSSRGDPDTLMILALSGGGSRSAYLSAKVMFRLQELFSTDEGIDLLGQVDAISSVSGGSLPAAYYAISDDPGTDSPSGRYWNKDTVLSLMTRNYTGRWFGNWFWPTNAVKYWTTGFDRTDIMANTFASNLYSYKGLKGGGRAFRMSDLRSSRPFLILNATNATAGQSYGRSFTFTDDDFSKAVASDIDEYSVARAVMGSATFPAVFNYMTLRDYNICENEKSKRRYVHIFDGGNSDNLGLTSVQVALADMLLNHRLPTKVVIIAIDAYSADSGVSSSRPDPRRGLDFVIDTNFVSATDSLLTANRNGLLENFQAFFSKNFNDSQHFKQSLYYHISFADIKNQALSSKLNAIPTDFRIEKSDVRAIDQAVDTLMTRENPCLIAIKDLVKVGSHSQPSALCKYQH
jgi:NTE family protein